jgi:putative addiction module component (TIGR02574 family)
MMSRDFMLDQMSLEDRIRLLEALWENLSREPSQLPAPDWHGEVLEQRTRRLESGEATVSSWAEAKERFDRLGR